MSGETSYQRLLQNLSLGRALRELLNQRWKSMAGSRKMLRLKAKYRQRVSCVGTPSRKANASIFAVAAVLQPTRSVRLSSLAALSMTVARYRQSR